MKQRLRREIDKIDRILAEALAERLTLVEQILTTKALAGEPTEDLDREAQVLRSVATMSSVEQMTPIQNIFKAILHEGKACYDRRHNRSR